MLIVSNQKEEYIPRTTGLLGALGILLEYARIQEFSSRGGGGVQVNLTKKLWQRCFRFWRGSNIIQGGQTFPGGVQLFQAGSNCLFPIEIVIFQGGSGPLSPLDPHLLRPYIRVEQSFLHLALHFATPCRSNTLQIQIFPVPKCKKYIMVQILYVFQANNQ